MAVAGNDVYIVNSSIHSKYWKNGTWKEFTNESDAIAWDIAIVPAGK